MAAGRLRVPQRPAAQLRHRRAWAPRAEEPKYALAAKGGPGRDFHPGNSGTGAYFVAHSDGGRDACSTLQQPWLRARAAQP